MQDSLPDPGHHYTTECLGEHHFAKAPAQSVNWLVQKGFHSVTANSEHLGLIAVSLKTASIDNDEVENYGTTSPP